MERLRSPLYAQIELTYACNLACNHCYNEPRFSNSNDIIRFNRVKRENVEADRFTDISQELVRHDVFAVTLTGGEVFTARDRLYSTIDVLASSGLEVTLNSNLTLVNEDDSRRLRDSGVNGIMTSLLSYNPEVHDRIVNKKGSEKRVESGDHGIFDYRGESDTTVLVEYTQFFCPKNHFLATRTDKRYELK